MSAVRNSPARTEALRAARRLLEGLVPGQTVILEMDGRALWVTVQRDLRGSEHDGAGRLVCGAPENWPVTVGYGPGRWNRELTACSLLPTSPPFHGTGLRLTVV